MKVLRVESGFTLLELMVAMALSVVIAMISALALGSGSDFYSRNTDRLTARSELRALDATLRAEWGLSGYSFKLTDKSVEFHTTQPRGSDAKNSLVLVRYDCNATERAEYSLVHTSFAVTTALDGINPTVTLGAEPRIESVLVRGLKSCAFSALADADSLPKKFEKLWTSQWKSEVSMPRLLKLKISLRHFDLPSFVFVAENR